MWGSSVNDHLNDQAAAVNRLIFTIPDDEQANDDETIAHSSVQHYTIFALLMFHNNNNNSHRKRAALFLVNSTCPLPWTCHCNLGFSFDSNQQKKTTILCKFCDLFVQCFDSFRSFGFVLCSLPPSLIQSLSVFRLVSWCCFVFFRSKRHCAVTDVTMCAMKIHILSETIIKFIIFFVTSKGGRVLLFFSICFLFCLLSAIYCLLSDCLAHTAVVARHSEIVYSKCFITYLKLSVDIGFIAVNHVFVGSFSSCFRWLWLLDETDRVGLVLSIRSRILN